MYEIILDKIPETSHNIKQTLVQYREVHNFTQEAECHRSHEF